MSWFRLLVVLLLASCGFHLRGEAHYAFETLYLNSPASQPLTLELRRSLEGGGSAKLVAKPEEAQAILDVTSVENNKQMLDRREPGRQRRGGRADPDRAHHRGLAVVRPHRVV